MSFTGAPQDLNDLKHKHYPYHVHIAQLSAQFSVSHWRVLMSLKIHGGIIEGRFVFEGLFIIGCNVILKFALHYLDDVGK